MRTVMLLALVGSAVSVLPSASRLDGQLAALDTQLRKKAHDHTQVKAAMATHAKRVADHKTARLATVQHKAEVHAMARSIVTAKGASVKAAQAVPPGVPSLPPLPAHDDSAGNYQDLYEAAQARLAALREHCANCEAKDMGLEVCLNYSVGNHTVAQEAAMALVTAQTEHSAAQTNFSDQITTYNNIKMRVDTTSIAWPDTPSLHQVVVDDATALKAQALVVQAARDTYYAKGNASEDAQANYTSAAANATTADEGVATAQAERDVACAPLSIAPSPPPTPPPPTPPPPTSPPPDAFEVRTSGRCANIATVEQCQGYAVHHSAHGGMLTTPPQQTFPLGCFMIRDWFGNGDQVFYKAETDPNTNRECNPTGRICLCAPP
jgi:hypothetical protein